ncbi:MAG TPA: sporulation transcriptional regulator SpoIIID [Clostridiales bacterium]|nr:sporulation transcriptional regulator SpoIIID [Clostridiales bacterium]
MKDYIEKRAMEIAEYIINTESTVRQTAKKFGVSKSTVHKDVTERLPKINPPIANDVKKILLKNKSERHIRGGKATRLKYKEVDKEVINL